MRIVRMILFVAVMVMLITPAGFAQEASPTTAEPGSFQERFLALASSMPDWLGREGISVHYADLAWRSEVVGIDPAESEDGLISVSVAQGMAIPPAFNWATLFPLLGFTSSQVNRTLLLDAIIDKLTLMEGEFDFVAMESALIESGYEAEEIDGVAVFVFGGDDFLDLTSDAGALAFSGKTQYVVLLEDGLVGFTNKRASAEALVAAHLGEGETLAMNADVQELLGSARVDIVSAQIWSLSALGEIVTTAEQAAMPPFRWILFGDSAETGWSTAGEVVESEPDAAGIIVLLMENADQVEAASTVVPVRVAELTSVLTGAPFTDLLTLKSAQPGASATTAVFEFDVPIIGRLSRMWEARDMAFIYPG